MNYEKYLITEKVSQALLHKKFNFIRDNEYRNKLVMDLWHYLDPRWVDKGKLFSTEPTASDEIIKRMNLDSYNWADNAIIDKIKKTIKSLGFDKKWVKDNKQKAFVNR
jgi:hypothetical protein